MLYTDDYDYERYAVFEVSHPRILKHIAQNLDMDLFDVDEDGYGYYGMFVDRMMGAIVVLTKNANGATIRMVFNGSKSLHVEEDGKTMTYIIGNKEMTLNKFLREFFDVPHAVDDCDYHTDDESLCDEPILDVDLDIFDLLIDDESELNEAESLVNEEESVHIESNSYPIDTQYQWVSVIKDTL